MDFFTDASLNDEKGVAGIGCLCVDGSREVSEIIVPCHVNNIHTAELCALAFAVRKAAKLDVRSARIVSDSVSAINILHNYMKCIKSGKMDAEQKKFLQFIERTPYQKAILENIVDTFKNSSVSYQFVHTDAHQKSSEVGSDAYWNKRADKAAKKGKKFAETIMENEQIQRPEELLDFPFVNGNCADDWRSRVQVPQVQAKPKNKTVPKKVSRHRKNMEDTCNVRIMVNVRINVRR